MNILVCSSYSFSKIFLAACCLVYKYSNKKNTSVYRWQRFAWWLQPYDKTFQFSFQWCINCYFFLFCLVKLSLFSISIYVKIVLNMVMLNNSLPGCCITVYRENCKIDHARSIVVDFWKYLSKYICLFLLFTLNREHGFGFSPVFVLSVDNNYRHLCHVCTNMMTTRKNCMNFLGEIGCQRIKNSVHE